MIYASRHPPLVETRCELCGGAMMTYECEHPRCAECAGRKKPPKPPKLKRDKYAALIKEPPPEKSSYTDGERRFVHNYNRGKQITPGSWRNFCCSCGLPMVVHAESARHAADLRCPDCQKTRK